MNQVNEAMQKWLHSFYKQKKSRSKMSGIKKLATTYSPANAVPLALIGLTSLFGMVRGGTPSQ